MLGELEPGLDRLARHRVVAGDAPLPDSLQAAAEARAHQLVRLDLRSGRLARELLGDDRVALDERTQRAVREQRPTLIEPAADRLTPGPAPSGSASTR